MMKIKVKIIGVIGTIIIATMVLFTACKEEITGPPTVPIGAEIKQVIVNNSIYVAEIMDADKEDALDSVVVIVPMGTDITQLELDIIYSYFGSISPEPTPVTDLTNPVYYTITSNVESRDYVIIAKLVPPSLTSFFITAPVESAARITGDSIILSLQEFEDPDYYSRVSFNAEYFGESIEPAVDETIDLTVDTIITVINKEFRNEFKIVIEWYKVIEFTGVLYDCTIHPSDFDSTSLTEDKVDGWAVEYDDAYFNGGALHFRSKEIDYGFANFEYGDMGLEADPNESTTIFRMKGIPGTTEDDDYLECAFHVGEFRVKLYFESDHVRLLGNDGIKWYFGDDPESNYDPTNWNIIRVTTNKITGESKMWINEEEEPSQEVILMGGSGLPRARFGDGGGRMYECLIDWIAFETGGAYSPEDLPLSKIFPQE